MLNFKIIDIMSLSKIENQIRNAVSAVKALEHVKQLAKIGDRFAGTSGDTEALGYVTKVFQELGLQIDKTEINILSFQEMESSFIINKPIKKEFKVSAAIFSPATPPEGLTGELIFLNEGEEEDYKGKDVEGKIIILRERSFHSLKFWMGKYSRLAKIHGALGIILIHAMPWPYRCSLEIGNSNVKNRFYKEQVPVVTISSTDGLDLLYQLGKGKTVGTLKVKTEVKQTSSYIVRGTLVGSKFPDERVSVIAHRDNGISPGANDNASGTATMLNIAEALHRYKPKRSLEFISSTAEEGATEGAWQYVEAHKDEMKHIKALFNIDMIATGGTLNLVDTGIWPDTPPLNHSRELNKFVEKIAYELGYSLGHMTAGWGVSESGRFIERGVPSIWFWKPDDPYYHSEFDSPERIESNIMKVVGDIVAISMWRIANMDEVPKFC